ncbi:MAG TPA: hypothetical protein VGE97_08790 [Nitrososphaera sp.]|jgi:hypothetical protein
MKDGGLRQIFRHSIAEWQWTSVETAGTASGVPDSEFCATCGITGWIEFKQTNKFYVQIKPLQVKWIDRRARMGGRVWIAVRRIPKAAKWGDVDELWLMKGDQAQALFHGGLENISGHCWKGGPKTWNFDEIKDILCGFKS